MNGNPRQQFCLKVWGDLAAFNRPELKIERLSYEVMTPSAARAIFSAIFWKWAILWHVRKIEVLNPIKTISIRKNEVAKLASGPKSIFIEDERQQKSGLCLRDVSYRIYADMEYIPVEQRKHDVPDPSHGSETPAKYYAMFARRAAKGQYFHPPYLGTRECAANFLYIPEDELDAEIKQHPALDASHDRDFGIMLYDMDFSDIKNPVATFFHAKMCNGTVLIPDFDSPEVLK